MSITNSSLPRAGSLSVEQARQLILQHTQALSGSQQLPVRNALDRILAEDLISPINVPACANSAMDGYAFVSADLPSHPELTLAGTALAGQPWQGQLLPGQAIRIMTGAILPAPCDSVIPQEQAVLKDERTLDMRHIPVRPGQHVRLCGEDLAAGSVAISSGKRLGPAELGLLASLGLAEIAVRRRLRIAIFSTGDELRSLGQVLETGCVYDSNRYTLYGMLTRLGVDIIDLGLVPDDPVALEQALLTASDQADAIITSGGVSVGEADYTKDIMAKLGEVAFWSINMRPGRPLAFGHITSGGKNTLLFGLPGNPVAVMVSFYFFVRPALLALAGAQAMNLPVLRAVASCTIPKRTGRTEFQRGICSNNLQGQLEVRITGQQGSGILSSMSEANCMVILKPEQGTVTPGDTVEILFFDGFI